MDFKAMDRIMGKVRPLTSGERMVRDRQAHQFSQDIGGNDANYRIYHPVAPARPLDEAGYEALFALLQMGKEEK